MKMANLFLIAVKLNCRKVAQHHIQSGTMSKNLSGAYSRPSCLGRLTTAF